MNDKIIFDKIKQLKDDNEKATLIPLIQNENIREKVIKRYILDNKIKLQQIKNLQNQVSKLTIFTEIIDHISESKDIIDDLISEIENTLPPFYALAILDEIPNSENFFNKKIHSICTILKKENATNKTIEQAENILEKAYSKCKIKDYTYKDFFSQIDNDTLIIDLVSLLKINNTERNNFYLSIQDAKLRKQVLLMISPKEKLTEKFKPENIKTIGLPPNLSIGVELEAEGVRSIAFNNTEFFNEWKSKKEDSLDHGVEVISPKLYDNQSNMEDLYLMTNLMKDFGLTTNENCGGHIHLGVDYLDTKESFENFWLLWLTNEQIIYKLCNIAGESPRNDIKTYAPSISSIYDEHKDELMQNIKNCTTRDEIISVIKNFQETSLKKLRKSERYVGLNFYNINDPEKNTIEFRISNGTLNFEEIQNNIRLYGRLFERSKEVSIIQKKYNEGNELTLEEMKKLHDFQILCSSDLLEETRTNILINFLFEENEREIYTERYQKSKTESIKTLFGKDSYKQFYEQLKSNDKKVPPIFDKIEGNSLESGDYVEH